MSLYFNILVCVYPILIIQYLVSYENMTQIIFWSKRLTKVKSYYFYFGILALGNYTIAIYTYIVFFIQRYIVNFMKYLVCQERPYNKYPNTIKWFKKHNTSYSFPSQSVACLTLIYNSYILVFPYYIVDLYFYIILGLLFWTRLYRGLHYVHDLLFSLILGNVFSIVVTILSK